jgi:hypothetical protein
VTLVRRPPTCNQLFSPLQEDVMTRVGLSRTIVLVFACAATSIPARAQQASGIAGLVRDSSGAVMPGVTVEASSPALIEKTRSAVTDTQGATTSSIWCPARIR